MGLASSMPIFDGGLRQATLDVRGTVFRRRRRYKGSVLAAYQDVENSLSSIRWTRIESAALSDAAKAAQRALDMSMSLYEDGAASSLDVVTSQSAALDAERADLAAKTRLLEQYVDLMLAFGGGWSGQAPRPSRPSRRRSRCWDLKARIRARKPSLRKLLHREGDDVDPGDSGRQGPLRPMCAVESNSPAVGGFLPAERAPTSRSGGRRRALADDARPAGLRGVRGGRLES